MKQIQIILSLLLIVFTLSACTENDKKNEQANESQKEIATDVDFDFTQISPVMANGHVFDILENPDNYLGKTFRLVGEFARHNVETLGQEFLYVVLYDALSCCPQGIEIMFKEGVKLPQAKSIIDVKATFKKIEDRFPRYYMEVYSLK